MEKEKVDVLIVVDMQNDFVTGSLGTPEAQAIVPKVVEKIKNWKGPVFYTMDTHYEDYLNTQEGKHLPIVHCVEGTDGWKLINEIGDDFVTDYEQIYHKKTFGSYELFIDATLCDNQRIYQTLFPGNVDSITLIGLCTDICVITNALILKTAKPEVPIIVDASCCAGVTPESHTGCHEDVSDRSRKRGGVKHGRDYYFRLIYSGCQVIGGTGEDITAARIIYKGEWV